MSAEVESIGSWPAIAPSPRAASSTVAPKTPTWSSDDAKATRPKRLTRPYVGFTPTMPQNAPRCRVLVRLAEGDGARRAEAGDDRRLVRAHVAFQNLRAARRGHRERGDV